jgi:antagonist of KipI
MEIAPLGDSAVILRVRDRFDDAPEKTLDAVLRVFRRLESSKIPEVIELAPGYTTVAVFFDPIQVADTGAKADQILDWLTSRLRTAVAGIADPGYNTRTRHRLIEIPVCYDAEFAFDVDDVAKHSHLPPREVIDLHSGAQYRVACIGFTPGFPFLAGLPKQLATPRRTTPRKEIPAGSVGIGGAQTGIYPLRSPGGWNIIGRTPLRMFDPDQSPPTLLRAGDRVRFHGIGREVFDSIKSEKPSSRAKSNDPGDAAFQFANRSVSLETRALVARAGFLTSIQDLGRPKFRQFGVSLSGALDPNALRIANLLVGNEESAAGLEVTFGGLQLRFEDKRIVAWCGGDFDVHAGSTVLPSGHAAIVNPGEELKIAHACVGCRCWLAISGGIDAFTVLGSRSTDLRASFGGLEGRVLRDGDFVPLGKPQSVTPVTGRIFSWSAPTSWAQTASASSTLRFIRGADWERFNGSTLQRIKNELFTVSADSDRMGVRLDGPGLIRDESTDLISEGVAPGTIQVPPSGKPILLLGDCQTMGGYPKIAHVITVDLPIAAQLRAGDSVGFREVSLTEAHQLLFERQRELELFRVGIKLHFE